MWREASSVLRAHKQWAQPYKDYWPRWPGAQDMCTPGPCLFRSPFCLYPCWYAQLTVYSAIALRKSQNSKFASLGAAADSSKVRVNFCHIRLSVCHVSARLPLEGFQLTLNIPRGVLWGPQRVIFCDPAVTISTNLLLIFVCVPHQLKINIMYIVDFF